MKFANTFGKSEMEDAVERLYEASRGNLDGFCINVSDVTNHGIDNDDDEAVRGLLLLIGYGWVEMNEDEEFVASKSLIERVKLRMVNPDTTRNISVFEDA